MTDFPQPEPGQPISDEQLAAIARVAQMGYLSPQAVLAMIDYIRELRRDRIEIMLNMAYVLPRVKDQLTLSPNERAAVTYLQRRLDEVAPPVTPAQTSHT